MHWIPGLQSRARSGAAVAVALATASGIAVNFATDLRTDLRAWLAVAIVAVAGVITSLRTQPADARLSRSVAKSSTSRWVGRPRSSYRAEGVHAEVIEETAAGGRVLVRAYTEQSASLLIAMHRVAPSAGGAQGQLS